ncbi:MAG: class II fructose-bisphosphate aldolase [Eubacteriales bacterium]
MPLLTPKQLYDNIPKDVKCAIGAFNVHDMEYTQAVIRAAEEENAPVILMLGEPMLAFANLDMLANITLFAAKNSTVPIAVTLDHGTKKENINRCIELGISVMCDCSHYEYKENIALTKEYTKKAHLAGVSVEAELGNIGGANGDEVLPENMTDPLRAKEFVEETGIDALAIAIGNCHGFYKNPPKLDIERLIKIKELVDIPLVLHGGSDLPLNMSNAAIDAGIRKFNIGTDLKCAYALAIKKELLKDPMPIQPPQILGPARDAVLKVTKQKIRLFRSNGIAKYYK